MLGSRLRKLRNDAGLSLQRLADVTGISKKTIDRYENITNGMTSAEYVARLAKYFHVSTDYLMGLTDEKTAYKNPDLTSDESRLLEAYREGNTDDMLLIITERIKSQK